MRLIKDDMPDETTKCLYRYKEEWFTMDSWDYRVKLILNKYPIIKETPCGFWIRMSFWSADKKRWVSKDGKSAYAKQTEEAALASYIKRKESHIGYLKGHMRKAEAGLELARRRQNEGGE